MATNDNAVSLAPYFSVNDMDTFRNYCERFVELTRNESKCLNYGFSFEGDNAHCRESYEDAEGVLAHLDNVGGLLMEIINKGVAAVTRLEIHGPADELDKLRKPLANFNPTYFTLGYGFRR